MTDYAEGQVVGHDPQDELDLNHNPYTDIDHEEGNNPVVDAVEPAADVQPLDDDEEDLDQGQVED